MTHTDTATISITGGDVRQVLMLATTEITAIVQAARHIPCDFELDSALEDCGLLLLNGIPNAIFLTVYRQNHIIREYRYQVVTGDLTSYGPPANQPPLGYVPPDARIRLTVSTDPTIDQAYAQEWFRRLGWSSAEALEAPENAHYVTYGAYHSGSLGLERSWLCDPAYDHAPQTSGHSASMQKRR